jgi:hypothetical protein
MNVNGALYAGVGAERRGKERTSRGDEDGSTLHIYV